MFVNKYVDEVHAHIWRLLVQPEEPSIVILSKCLSDSQGMNDAGIVLFLLRQFLHHTHSFHFHAAEYLVQDFVGEEFLEKKLGLGIIKRKD